MDGRFQKVPSGNVKQQVDAVEFVKDMLNVNMDAAEIAPDEEVPEAQRLATGLPEERDEKEDALVCSYRPDCLCFPLQ